MPSLKKYKALCFLEIIVICLLGFLLINRIEGPQEPADSAPAVLDTKVAPPSEKVATMLFVGDMMFDRYVAKKINEAQDPLLPFALIKEFLDTADFLVGNLEGPISARGQNQGSIYSFRFAPTSTLHALRYGGFDLLTLANNHIFDYGLTAAKDTFASLADAGIAAVGFGEDKVRADAPVIKKIGDANVAFLAYTEFYGSNARADETGAGLSTWDRREIMETIRRLRSSADIDLIVVNVHWGVEYKTAANLFQQELARQLVGAGADLIVGHHPHVVQEVEFYSPFRKGRGPPAPAGKPAVRDFEIPPGSAVLPLKKGAGYIAYSLGNFIFDQNFSEETKKGLILQVDLRGKEIEKVTPIEVRFTSLYQPYIPVGR